jgi:ribulose-5-phosphate 4-epimerase/fuculose-1-phosphate aldolase
MEFWQRPSHISVREWSLRFDLACAYRVAHAKGWDELIYNHITLRCPTDLVNELCLPVVVSTDPEPSDQQATAPLAITEEAFFINPFGVTFDEVTPFNLLLVSYSGTVLHAGYPPVGGNGLDVPVAPEVLLPALLIHSALHQARPEIQAIWHCHASPVVAVSSMRCGFLQGFSQESVIVSPKLSHQTHAFEGVVSEPGAEQQRLSDALGQKQVLLMANHGVVSCGVLGLYDAFYNLHLLVRACEHQVTAMSAVGGRVEELQVAPDSVVTGNEERMLKQEGVAMDQHWGRREWDAVKRQTLRRVDTAYRQRVSYEWRPRMDTSLPSTRLAVPKKLSSAQLSPSAVRTTRPVKLLLLHGFPGHIGSAGHVESPSKWLKQSLLLRGYDLHIVEPRAPTATDGDVNGVAWIAGGQVAAGKVCGFYQRGWAGVDVDAVTLEAEASRTRRHAEDGKWDMEAYSPSDLFPLTLPQDNIWTGSRGYLDSLHLLEQVWLANDGFDGISGFSQGALTTSLFISYLRHKYMDCADVTVKQTNMYQPAFAILCGGFARPWPAEASPYWPPASFPNEERLVAPYETVQSTASRLLEIPSLHIIGRNDAVVAPCRSDELCDMYTKNVGGISRQTYRHDLIGAPSEHGGHVLPWTEDFHDKVAVFLDDVYGNKNDQAAAADVPAAAIP